MILKKELVFGLAFYILFLFTVIPSKIVNAQELSGEKLNTKNDSSEVTRNIYNPFLFSHKFQLIIPSEETGIYNLDIPENNPHVAWGMTLAALRQSLFIHNETGNSHINLYLNNFLYTEKGMIKTIRNILGIAGMSAAGYFAFKHIQKYGFIKDKKQK